MFFHFYEGAMMKNLYKLLYGCFMLFAVATLFGQNSQWVRYTTANSGLPSDTVAHMKFDGNGNLWIGYYGGPNSSDGIARFNGTAWTSYSDEVNGFIGNDFAFLNGNVWVGLEGAGLAKFNGETWYMYTSDNSSLLYNDVLTLSTDNVGNLWIGSTWGLNKLKPDNTWSTYTSEQSFTHFPTDEVDFIVKDSSGN